MNTTTPNTTRPVSFIRFHGMTLLVVDNDGVQYIPLKPLSDLAGIDWRNTKRGMEQAENITLMGAKWLEQPVFVASGGDITPTPVHLYIRLDRARMYLARINTARMKAHGNVDAAEQLLALQIEWAEALHAYETDGVATKRSTTSDQTSLLKQRANLRKELAASKDEGAAHDAYSDYQHVSQLLNLRTADLRELAPALRQQTLLED